MLKLSLLLALILVGIASGAPGNVTLTADSLWLVSPSEPTSVQMAISDIQRDWYKALGLPPAIATSQSSVPANWNGPIICVGLNASWLQPFRTGLDQPEMFRISVEPFMGTTAIVITGSDALGTIYGAYAFSEHFLGVDSWWYWTDFVPAFVPSISIPASLSIQEGPPAVRYRVWFTNDEDLLGGWAADPLAGAVFHIEMWDKVFEAALRSRANGFIVGTVPYWDEVSLDLAARSGLYIMTHHFNILGDNTFRWPAGVPFSFAQSPEIMEYVWTATVNASAHRNNIWALGYRGLNDYPFWIDDPAFNTDAKRGALISAAMAKEKEVVETVLGMNSSQFVMYLWAEFLSLYNEGYLTVPQGTTLVWTDNGSGTLPPVSGVKPGDGIYYHTQMFDGVANQLTEMTPPARIFANLIPYYQQGATSYFILNLSDVRPSPMTSQLTMMLAWDFTRFLSWNTTDPVEMQRIYITEWAQRMYGLNYLQAAYAADLWAGLFNLSYYQQGKGDNWLAGTVRGLVEDVQAGKLSTAASNANVTLQELSPCLDQLYLLYSGANSILSAVPDDRSDFVQAHLVTQFGIHFFGAKAMAAVASAVIALASNQTAKAISDLQLALSFYASLFAEERKAEYGKWSGFYQFDQLTGFPTARAVVAQLLAKLQGQPIPYYQSYNSLYYSFYDYQIPYPNFPLMHENPYVLTWAVRILCASDGCTNTPVGGNYTTPSANVSMFVPLPGATIRFTTDGTDPSPSSPVYSAPITISANVTSVNARAYGPDGTEYLVSRSMFYRNLP